MKMNNEQNHKIYPKNYLIHEALLVFLDGKSKNSFRFTKTQSYIIHCLGYSASAICWNTGPQVVPPPEPPSAKTVTTYFG